MKKLLHFILLLTVVSVFLVSCKEDEGDPLPTSAIIHYSIAQKQVAFTALAINANTYLWDFGDGETSTEPNPVHVYSDGGYYKVTLSVTGGTGTVNTEVNLAVDLTPYVLLTGGATATQGKTWKLTAAHTKNDRLANADATFTIASGAPAELPTGAFDLFLGMGEVYQDTYTFHYDGGYSHDVKADNAAFSGLVYQLVTTGGAGIVNMGGKDFGLCTGKFTPEANATFTYVEREDFEVPSVYGPGGKITYPGVSTLDFSGKEFLGFMDFQRKVILQDITDKTMRVVMFMAASPDHLPLNTHALVLTFSVVE
jgi:hypothetical protein